MKVMLISFFISNNIGDLLISESCTKRLEKDCEKVVKYDFLEVKKVDKLYSDIDMSIVTNHQSWLKRMLKKVLGSSLQLILYQRNTKRRLRLQHFIEDLKDCEKVYFAGGNMLMDTTVIWPLILQDYVNVIRQMRIPYQFLAVGAGPIIHGKSKRILKELLFDADKISVRGEESAKVLNQIGIQNVQVDIDPVLALHLEKEEIRKVKIREFQKNKKVKIGIGILGEMCFSSRKQYREYKTYMIRMLKNLEKLPVVEELILYSTESMDYKAVAEIYTEYGKDTLHIFRGKSAKELIEFYDGLDYIISGRMHSLIVAQRCMVPFIGILWQKKVEEFAQNTNTMEDMVSVKGLAELGEQTLRLERKIDFAWLEKTKWKNEKMEERLDSIFK